MTSWIFVFSLLCSVGAIDVQMYDTLAMKCQNGCNGHHMAFTNVFIHVPIWLEATVKYSQAFFECACFDQKRALTDETSFLWVLLSLSDEVAESCKTALGGSRYNGLFMLRAPAPTAPVFSCNMDSAGRRPSPPKEKPVPAVHVTSAKQDVQQSSIPLGAGDNILVSGPQSVLTSKKKSLSKDASEDNELEKSI